MGTTKNDYDDQSRQLASSTNQGTSDVMKRGAALEGARRLKGQRRNFLAVLGCMVAFVTAFALMVPAITMTKGDLVCGMEEHAHSKACYEQVLVCGQEEGEGADPETGEGGHEHAKGCYEKQLTCGLEEHKHTDACYAPEQADAGSNEAAEVEETAASDGEESAAAVESDDAALEDAGQNAEESDAIENEITDNQNEEAIADENSAASAEAERPAQNFYENLKNKDADGNEYIEVAVSVEAPEGAFPVGTTMKIARVEDADIQAEVEQAVKDAKGENASVKRMTAVDIKFLDAEGNEIEPAAKVDVKISTTDLRTIEKPVLVHVVDKGKENQTEKKTDAEVLKKVNVVNWDDEDKSKGNEDTLKFATREFSPYVIVEVETITADVITASGEAYKITVSYDEEAGIPEGATLQATEIAQGSDDYQGYLNESAQKLGLENADGIEFARFFDIQILNKDGEKLEPAAAVDVDIKLTDAPDATDKDNPLQVVHFKSEGPQLIEAEAASADTLQFATDSFSVYGVITTTPPSGVNDLAGRSFTISKGSNYITSDIVGSNPSRFGKSNIASNAATWQFEATGTAGQYNIFTMVDGAKKYMQIVGTDGGRGSNAALGDSPQAFTVIDNNNGTYTLQTHNSNGSFYLNEWAGANGIGFAGYMDRNTNDDSLTFNWTQPAMQQNGQYITLVKYNDKYYIVNNDASLTEVDYDPDTNTVAVDDPMMWTIERNNSSGHIYFNSVETGFNWQQTASDWYRRYLDPTSDNARTEEDSSNVTLRDDGDRWAVGVANHWRETHITDRSNIERQTAVNINNDPNDGKETYTIDHNGVYLGIEFDDSGNPVKLSGNKGAGDAAEFLFASPTAVKGVGRQNNTVNHIDISINGTADVSVPLAYGKYYGPQGDAADPIKTVTSNYKLELSKDQMVDQTQLKITADDMKRATITATRADNGQTIDDAFYVTGYSGNVETSLSADQVRIEGSFLVADLRGSEYETINTWQYDNNETYRNNVRTARLANIVEYTVTVVKPIKYKLIDPELGQLYDEDGNEIIVTVDVAFSASFNYWDERNECPAVRYASTDGTGNWQAGGIDSGDLSGMDFVLGGNANNPNSPLVALEITKVIMDEEGNRIELKTPVTNYFDIYEKKTATNDEKNGVQGLHVVDELNHQAWTPDDRDATVRNGYDYWRTKRLTVDETGSAIVFDFNATDAMYYIIEKHDEESLPETVVDKHGEEWTYVKTYIETEYVRRDDDNGTHDEYSNKTLHPQAMHTTEDYTRSTGSYASIPEVAGHFTKLDGQPKKEGFLEFYVYNVYTKGTKLDVEKKWEPEGAAGVPNGTEVTMDLQFRMRKVGTMVDGVEQWYQNESDYGAWMPNADMSDEALFPVKDGDNVDWALVKDNQAQSDEDTSKIFGSGVKSTITLTSADADANGVWKNAFTGLPKTWVDDSGNVYELDYNAKETSVKVPGKGKTKVDSEAVDVTNQYQVTSTKMDATGDAAETSDGTATIINAKGSLVLEKQWLAPDGETVCDAPANTNAQITADVYRYRATSAPDTTIPGESVTVTIMARPNSNSQYTEMTKVEDLAKGEALSFSLGASATSVFTYYTNPVMSDGDKASVNGKTITYKGNYTDTKSGNANLYTLSNINANTTIYATFNNDNVTNINQIGWYVDESYKRPQPTVVPGEVAPEDSYVKTITLNKDNGWRQELTADEMESGWVYYIREDTIHETQASDYDYQAPTVHYAENGDTIFTAKNISKGVSLDVEKVWDPAGSAPNNAELTIDLQYQIRPVGSSDEWSEPAFVKDHMGEGDLFHNTGVEPTITLSADSEWKGKYEGLPTKVQQGDNTYDVTYTAFESAVMVDGKDVAKQYRTTIEKVGSSSVTSDGKVTITNKRETIVVTVEKQWAPEPTNEDASVTVELHRYAKKTKGTFTVTLTDQNNAAVPGADFKLQELKDGNWADTETTATTDVNGVVSATNLEPGTYRWVQVTVPAGYSLPDGASDPQVSETFEVLDNQLTKQEKNASLENKALKTAGRVTLTVLDNKNNPVAGSTFTLYKDNEPMAEKTGLQTNTDGQIVLDDLEPGSYFFEQTAAADGYKMPANVRTDGFVVEENKPGEDQAFTESMTNELKGKGSATITLTVDPGGDPIEGAHFELWTDGAKVAEGNTDAQGMSTFGAETKLDAGEYTVKQTSAGANADLMLAADQTFTILDNGEPNQSTELSFVNTYKSAGTATVTVTRADNNDPVSGAIFELWKEGSTSAVETATTDDNGQLIFGIINKLELGKYTVKQTSTADDLDIAAEQGFEILDNHNPNQSANLAFQNAVAAGNVTIELWRKGGNDNTYNGSDLVSWNWGQVDGSPVTKLRANKEYTFTAKMDTGIYPDNVWIYIDEQAHKNGDPLDTSKIKTLEQYGGQWNNGTYTFTFTPTNNDTTYSIVLISGWGSGNIKSITLDSSAANANSAPKSAKALKAARANAAANSAAKVTQPAKAQAARVTDAQPAEAPEGYTNDSSFCIEYPLGASDSWQHAFAPQDKYDADGNEYLYYVVETAHNPEDYWIASYENEQLSETGTITVTNEQKLGALTVTKAVTVDGNPIPDGASDNVKTLADGTYTFEITGPNNYTQTETITVSNGVAAGSIVLNDLPAGTYYVEEKSSTNENGITLVAGKQQIEVAAGSTAAQNTVAFTNNLETTQVTVNKVWNDEETEHDAIHYSVCRIPVAGTTEYDPQTVATGTLSADNGWTETIANLPKAGKLVPTEGADAVDVTYRYYVSEENVHGYSSEVTEGASDSNGQNFTITNTPYGHFSDQTDITINKKWKNADGTDAPADEHDNDSITFQVTQKKHEAKTADGKAIYPVRINLVNADGTTSNLSETIYMPQDVRLDLKPQSSAAVTHHVHVVGVDGRRSNTSVLPNTSLYIQNANGGRVITLTLQDTGETWGTSASANTWTLAKSATVATNIISKSDLLSQVAQTGGISGASSYVMELTDDKTGTVVGKYGTAIGNPAGSEGTKWAGSVNDLPFFEEEDGVFYVYTYEVTEVKINETIVQPTQAQGFKGETSTYYVTWEGDANSWIITNQKRPDINLTLRKIAKNDVADATVTTATLPGATFTLEKYTAATYQQKDLEWREVTVADADNTTTGVFNFANLPEGYYKLVETVAPSGYVKSSTDPRFHVKLDQGSMVVVLIGENGNEIDANQTDMLKVDNATIYVGNEPGKPLPVTGGEGTAGITLLGSAVMLAGLGMLTIRRRRDIGQADD